MLAKIYKQKSHLTEEFNILAPLIYPGSPQKGKEITYKLLKDFASFADLLGAVEIEWDHLAKYHHNLPVFLSIIKEMAHRYNGAFLPQGDLLMQERRLVDYLVAQMARERVEQFRIIFLNKKNHLIIDEVQSKGTVNHIAVYPREVARRCIALRASSIIMVHNHPSGQNEASKADVIMTHQVQLALSVIKVTLADHYIITRHAQMSFRKSGLLYDL